MRSCIYLMLPVLLRFREEENDTKLCKMSTTGRKYTLYETMLSGYLCLICQKQLVSKNETLGRWHIFVAVMRGVSRSDATIAFISGSILLSSFGADRTFFKFLAWNIRREK